MDERRNDKSIGKIILIVVLVAVVIGLLIYFIARMRNNNENETTLPTLTSSTSSNTNASTTNTTNTTSTTQAAAKGTLGSQTVEIKSHRLVKDAAGKNVIIVTYTVTNNGNAAMNFLNVLSDTAYQGATKLDAATLQNIADFDGNSASASIAKGASMDVQKAFVLKDMTTAVKVDIKQISVTNNEVVSKTFDIK